jgi:NAD(P)-dependent dehydrogenase (short-subunit alcohol dehydrogenase family)
MTSAYLERVTTPSTSVTSRLLRGFWKQSRYNPVCPATPRLDGQLALVTGGNRGIGLETSRGLAARGAQVLAASRAESRGDVPARFVKLDLSDLESVARCIGGLASDLGDRKLGLLVANAGLWPGRHETSAQGHEIAFATNVLGHHALIRGLLQRGILAPDARVIVVTGDIYIMAYECTPDFEYRGTRRSRLAYCRSKLGNLWFVRELSRRYPELRVYVVHPGVIASELAGGNTGLAGAVKRALMLSPEAGAQTTLFCASQPGLVSGAYYHNTQGRMELRDDDPAYDARKAEALWTTLEELAQPFLRAHVTQSPR